MPDTVYLSTDPSAGKPVADAMQSPEFLQSRDGGYWEDKGVAGKVWHPTSGGSERTRTDNTVGGLPPELAAVGAIGVARAAAAPAASLMGHALNAVKSVATQAAPVVKYQIAKTSLESIGVSPAIAMPIAFAVSGYKMGQPSAATTTAAADTATEVVSDATKPFINAARYQRISALVKQGVPMADAVKTVLSLPAPGK